MSLYKINDTIVNPKFYKHNISNREGMYMDVNYVYSMQYNDIEIMCEVKIKYGISYRNNDYEIKVSIEDENGIFDKVYTNFSDIKTSLWFARHMSMVKDMEDYEMICDSLWNNDSIDDYKIDDDVSKIVDIMIDINDDVLCKCK